MGNVLSECIQLSGLKQITEHVVRDSLSPILQVRQAKLVTSN